MQHLTGELKVFNYSRHNKEIYCTVCVLYGRWKMEKSKLGRLVKQPFQNYAHLTGRDGYLTEHLKKTFTTQFTKIN